MDSNFGIARSALQGRINREDNLLSDSRENHTTLHTTSNALLRRAVLALDEPGIGPGIQRYQPRFQ